MELLRLGLWPDRRRAAGLALRLAEPFASDSAAPAKAADSSRSAVTGVGWRDWLRMPFAGPLSMTGFFGGIVSTFAQSPLIAVARRRRKYFADATAVQLCWVSVALSMLFTWLPLAVASNLLRWLAG